MGDNSNYTPKAKSLDDSQAPELLKLAEESEARASMQELLFKETELFVNFNDRIIYLESDIDIYAPAFIRRRIDLIANLTDDWKTPITLQICSYGGDAYAALAICDIIDCAPMPINTVGIGPVMSAAGFVLVSGSGIRAVTKNSYIMIHDIFGMVQGKSKDVAIETDHWKKLQDRCYKLFAEKTCKGKTFWKNKSKNTFYASTDEALKLNIIDKVLTTWTLTGTTD